MLFTFELHNWYFKVIFISKSQPRPLRSKQLIQQNCVTGINKNWWILVSRFFEDISPNHEELKLIKLFYQSCPQTLFYQSGPQTLFVSFIISYHACRIFQQHYQPILQSNVFYRQKTKISIIIQKTHNSYWFAMKLLNFINTLKVLSVYIIR